MYAPVVPASQPSFVLIMTDTQGVNVLGPYAELEARRRGEAPTAAQLRTPRFTMRSRFGVVGRE